MFRSYPLVDYQLLEGKVQHDFSNLHMYCIGGELIHLLNDLTKKILSLTPPKKAIIILSKIKHRSLRWTMDGCPPTGISDLDTWFVPKIGNSALPWLSAQWTNSSGRGASASFTFCPKYGHITFSWISHSTAKIRQKHLSKNLLEALG